MDNKTIVRLFAGLFIVINLLFAGCDTANENEVVNSATPILDVDNPPYVLDNKLIVTFNMKINLESANKVKIFRNPATVNAQIIPTAINVNTQDRRKLEIKLPEAVVAGEVYRLAMEPGFVYQEGTVGNRNKAIAPTDKDITIGAAPNLDSSVPAYLLGQEIIVSFDNKIKILDTARIRYQLRDNIQTDFGTAIVPKKAPTVINNTKLVLTLDKMPATGEVYRIVLDTGAIGEENTAYTKAVKPTDKDITVSDEPTLTDVKPVFRTKKTLNMTFPVNVVLLNADAIMVERRDAGKDFVTVNDRSIAVDSTDTQKINITLTQDAVGYTQNWRVKFPIGSVMTPGRVANTAELITDEGVLRLTDIYTWNEVTSKGNKWSIRNNHTSMIFKNKIWVMGGWNKQDLYLNDVWSSADGISWTEESTKTGSTPRWSVRREHVNVVFKDKIWVMGGFNGTVRLNDVWNSADGISWTKVELKANAEKWSARSGHTSVVFDDGNGDKIWVMGGFGSSIMNDVWNSADGAEWTKKIETASWGIRFSHESAVFDGKIWVLGGFGVRKADAWYSADGSTWVEASSFKENYIAYYSSVVFENRLWNLSGAVNNTISKYIWSSGNPINGWQDEKAGTLPARSGQSSVTFDGKIWVLGGADSSGRKNDVWNFGPASE